MAQSFSFSSTDGEKGQREPKQWGHDYPFPYSILRAVLLESAEEALAFKGLLKLGKTSNKEISCHMRVAGKTGIQSHNSAL